MNERTYYSHEAEQKRSSSAPRWRWSAVRLVSASGHRAALRTPKGEETRKVLGEQAGQVYDNGRVTTGTAVETLRKNSSGCVRT
jgi:hypothetical protein